MLTRILNVVLIDEKKKMDMLIDANLIDILSNSLKLNDYAIYDCVVRICSNMLIEHPEYFSLLNKKNLVSIITRQYYQYKRNKKSHLVIAWFISTAFNRSSCFEAMSVSLLGSLFIRHSM